MDDPKRNPVLDPAMSVPEGLDSCPECNLQFLDSNSLNLHRVRKHSAKQQAADLPCPICQGFVCCSSSHHDFVMTSWDLFRIRVFSIIDEL